MTCDRDDDDDDDDDEFPTVCTSLPLEVFLASLKP